MSIIPVVKVREGAILPTRGSEKAAGFDLYACTDEAVYIDPGETKKI